MTARQAGKFGDHPLLPAPVGEHNGAGSRCLRNQARGGVNGFPADRAKCKSHGVSVSLFRI